MRFMDGLRVMAGKRNVMDPDGYLLGRTSSEREKRGQNDDEDRGDARCPRLPPHKAMQQDVFFRSVTGIASNIAQMPFAFERYERSDAERDQILGIFNESPHPRWTGEQLWTWVVVRMLVWGVAFVAIERRGARLTGLRPIQRMRLREKKDGSGEVLYYDRTRGMEKPVDPGDVMQFNGFGYDGVQGKSILDLGARESTGMRYLLDLYTRTKALGGDLAETAILLRERADEQVLERTRQEFLNTYATGVRGVLPMIFGRQVAEILNLAPRTRALSLHEEKSFYDAGTARSLGMPAHLVGLESAYGQWGRTFAEQRQSWKQITLMPLMRDIINEVNRKMFPTGRGKLRHDTSEFDALLAGMGGGQGGGDEGEGD